MKTAVATPATAPPPRLLNNMKKAYLVISVIAFIIPVAHIVIPPLIDSLSKDRNIFADLNYILETVTAAGIPLIILMPMSFICLLTALVLPQSQNRAKQSCLAVPIVITILIYTSLGFVGG